MEGLLAVVGLGVTTEGVRTGTGTERWRERVPDFIGCNAKTAGVKMTRPVSTDVAWSACVCRS